MTMKWRPVWHAFFMPSAAQLLALMRILAVIFLSLLVGWVFRNDIPPACLLGLVACLLAYLLIGRVERWWRGRNPVAEETSPSPVKVAEGASFTPPVGSSGMRFLLYVVSASVGPIVEDFQTLAGRTPSENVFARENYDDLFKQGWHKPPPDGPKSCGT